MEDCVKRSLEKMDIWKEVEQLPKDNALNLEFTWGIGLTWNNRLGLL